MKYKEAAIMKKQLICECEVLAVVHTDMERKSKRLQQSFSSSTFFPNIKHTIHFC